MMQGQGLLAVTPAARAQIKHLLATRGDGAKGIKLGVNTKGCSGHAYTIDFAHKLNGDEEVVQAEPGVTIYVEPGAVMYLLGTEVDYQQDRLGAMFVFNNPNEKGRCGCGESFHV